MGYNDLDKESVLAIERAFSSDRILWGRIQAAIGRTAQNHSHGYARLSGLLNNEYRHRPAWPARPAHRHRQLHQPRTKRRHRPNPHNQRLRTHRARQQETQAQPGESLRPLAARLLRRRVREQRCQLQHALAQEAPPAARA